MRPPPLSRRLTEGVAAWRDEAAVGQAAERWVRESLEADGRAEAAVFVAVCDDTVKGFVSVSQRRHWSGEAQASVGELAVDPSTERIGHGRALLAAAEQWALSRGLSFASLQTGAANAGARAFYCALGYREEEVTLTRSL